MAAKPFVVIEFGGKSRHLRLEINDLCEVEELVGHPIAGMNQENTGFREIRALLFCGLKGEDRSLTLKKVGEMMQATPPEDWEKFNKAIMEALGVEDAPGDDGPNAKAA